MTDRRQLKTPGCAGHLVRFLTEDSGAARHDRLLLIAGGSIVCGLLVLMWAADTIDGGGDTAAASPATTAAVPLKTVSSAPLRAPEPPPSEGAEGSGGRVFVATDYSSVVSHGYDREEQLLENELAQIREAEAEAAAAAESEDAVNAAAVETAGGS